MLQLFESPLPKTPPPVASGKSALGQYMTPANIAGFMVSLFSQKQGRLHLLDAGGGEGSLSCAFLNAWREGTFTFSSGELDVFELDSLMLPVLKNNISNAVKQLPLAAEIHHGDFIEQAVTQIHRRKQPYTHAILNPPYKKINSNSQHRLLLRDVGIETVNLYTAFVALSVSLLAPNGQLVAIIPRSFCNGPYYRPFREFILRHTALRHIHLFTARNKAFKADNVLQENCIILLEKDVPQEVVTVSTSTDDTLHDYASHAYPFANIVHPGDAESFFHIPAPEQGEELQVYPAALSHSLADIGLEVSTGPVVDFRLKEYLHSLPQPGDVPLLYPGHFNGHTEWPKEDFKKANAIMCCPETMKWLYPMGFYVAVRRLSSKEEKRRIVAHTVNPADFPDLSWLGFENHLNVFHSHKQGIPEDIARGLAVYLNSSIVDTMFRRFNGHTQVNATDLRALRYPSRKQLTVLGVWSTKQNAYDQNAINHAVETLL